MKKNKSTTIAKSSASKEKKSFYQRLSYPKKRVVWGLIFLLPWAIGILTFFLGPLLKTFYYSFYNMTLQTGGFLYEFVGFDNFKYALTVDPDFNSAVVEAFTTSLFNSLLQVFVSLFVAILLSGEYKGRGFFRLVFFIPIILATGITSIELTGTNVAEEASQSFINVDWIINILTTGGIPSTIVSQIQGVVTSIFDTITTAGVQMLIFLAGLQSISPTLYEVATIEGCTKFESFCKITLPMISPMILVCAIYSLADNFSRADVTETISSVTFTSGKYGLGASMSAIYFFVSVFTVLIISGVISKGVFYYDK